MVKPPAVALLVETSNSYARGLLNGIISYIRAHRPWSIYLHEQGRGAIVPGWLSSWSGDGIIARIENGAIAEAARRTGLPVVDLSAGRLLPDAPCVETHNGAIARLALEHLVERGFRTLAFCGDSTFRWSCEREEHFRNLAAERGLRFKVFDSARGRRTSRLHHQQKEMARWLLGLPKPVGIAACYDITAHQVLEACRTVGVAVPEEAAVLGVDNDELLCNLATPPLSSVILNTHRTGYEAAALLDRMLHGERIAPEVFAVEPLGIATRQSTDVLAINHADVASAVRFIRDFACDGINVNDVLAAVPVSRRILDKLFLKHLGRTPHAEIVRVRVEKVKELLRETDLTTAEIARATGFKHVEYLSAAFKGSTGVPPIAFRRHSRSK